MDIVLKGGQTLERKLAELARLLVTGATVKIGFLDKATYPGGGSVAAIAAIQDYGAPAKGIPPRPFFRNMVRDKSSSWPQAIEQALIANGYDANLTLRQVGAGVAGQLRQSVVDTNYPPLAPSTIAKKGHSKPLVDTGHMLASIDYEVT